MQSVVSSNIHSVGYKSGDLFVRFLRNRSPHALYVYHGVPERVYRELMEAPSHGKYLARNIKGVYSYEQIASADAFKGEPVDYGDDGEHVAACDDVETVRKPAFGRDSIVDSGACDPLLMPHGAERIVSTHFRSRASKVPLDKSRHMEPMGLDEVYLPRIRDLDDLPRLR